VQASGVTTALIMIARVVITIASEKARSKDQGKPLFSKVVTVEPKRFVFFFFLNLHL
jgi:hypothetical protein